ncbi:hypothetical protein [Paraflavitalea speifideaquila]|nr:hypothetical protein [Paraflavitalea speifideiaquila]
MSEFKYMIIPSGGVSGLMATVSARCGNSKPCLVVSSSRIDDF